jgi:hypothetical protein
MIAWTCWSLFTACLLCVWVGYATSPVWERIADGALNILTILIVFTLAWAFWLSLLIF